MPDAAGADDVPGEDEPEVRDLREVRGAPVSWEYNSPCSLPGLGSTRVQEEQEQVEEVQEQEQEEEEVQETESENLPKDKSLAKDETVAVVERISHSSPSSTSSSSPSSPWSPRLLLAISVVLLSCCTNVIFLELLVRQDPGIGNLVTFAQFLVIALEGLVFTTRLGTVGPRVPFRSWLTLVVMYFMVSVANNYALSYHVPMPLHMVFRAGSLMANMVMGMVLLGRRYTVTKYASVVMITVGIATCTVMSATSRVSLKTGKAVFAEEEGRSAAEEEEERVERVREMLTGIGLLVAAMLLSARMGVYQELLYSEHGKHPREALFYTHALPLPGFLLLAPDILHHWSICLSSPPLALPLTSLTLPSMLVHLAGNVVPQYLCITAVFVLTAECTSLTATLVLTLRKFLSLLFSIWYFQNPFSPVHWLGTALVFGGIVLFSDFPGLLRGARRAKQD